jgi:hypothetical protein
MSTYHRLSLRGEAVVLWPWLKYWHDSLKEFAILDYKGTAVRQPRNGIVVALVRQNLHERCGKILESSSSSSSGSIGCYLRCCLTCSQLWFGLFR